MNYAVRYFSRSGNTKKVAEAIADAVGVAALDVTAPLLTHTDILFLGSALYAGGIDEQVKTFLQQNKDKIGMICNFSTSASPNTTRSNVAKLATEYGIPMAEEAFDCRGKFLFMHRSRPNEKDLQAAAEFAKNVMK